ncbi:flagellar export chaperone FliS [Lacrimispora saccharolytica]|uniref:Flagellar protein FliS n=1 Tax=Lacrimispora saccharolytica (strain ATCC 35040 / DSM 2544 / NRCC 2533 / WM1) TaxID=610130 RepID=D9R9Z1_LACSW|nr:flagellar export chaperone FliS [Lacrimispora saccharolytica]ADL05963.1 flagellar protein FliS [[Clostridium] saccharolyticum WM1]QRV19907.1 flagellar export chaperone FliS [Lacrimispora saccharolytica]
MASYGYQHYKEQTVNTMTPGEMLNLLYDELLKRLTRAELALEKEDFELFEQSVQRAVDIVTYLKDTLNYNYEISAELRRMYDFFLYEFSRIRAGRNTDVIEEIRPLIIDLREAFKEAERLNS